MKIALLISFLFFSVGVQAQPQRKATEAEMARAIAKLNSHLILQAAAAKDAAEAETPRTLSAAVPVTEEMKTSGFFCYLTTWHMSGRMIRYTWVVRAERPDSEYPYFTVDISTLLKTPKTLTDAQGVVIETKEEWEPAQTASQVARTLSDIALKSESIHKTIRTDAVTMQKPRFATGLLYYPEHMSIHSGLNSALTHGFSADKLDKVIVQKHPGFESKDFPPTKPNEFQCFYQQKY